MTSRSWTAGLVAVACLLATSSAAATPVAIKSLSVDIRFNLAHRAFLGQIGDNCETMTSAGYQDLGRKRPRRVEYGLAYFSQGTFDGVTHAGQVHQVGSALKIEGFVRGPIRHLYIPFFSISDVGIEAAGGKLYVTARLRNGVERLSAARSVRIAVIARPKFLAGPATVPRHPSQHVPNTFVMAIQGQATTLSPLSKAIARLRCSRKTNKFVHPHAVRPGTALGLVTVQLRPNGAVGTDGTVDLLDVQASTENGDVQIQPVAPATRATIDEVTAFRLPFASGNHVALNCDGGSFCEAAGGKLSLVGGVSATANGRTATIDSIQVFYEGSRDPPEAGLTAAINGRPVTLVAAGDREFTDEALAALSDALGVRVTSSQVFRIEDTYTLTEPL